MSEAPRESIYNFIAQEEVPPEKPQRYTSKYRPTVALEKKSTKDAKKTMGPAKVEIPSPEKYLKKQSKPPKLPEKTSRSKDLHQTCTVRKAAVPARTDIPPMGIHTKRNFIKTATMVPMKPQPIWVDTSKGHKQILANSGLVPKYVNKKHYGEVPEYLQQRNEEERRAQEEYDNLVRESKEQGAMKHLSEEEQQAVLQSLKRDWDQLHHEYQGLSLITDNLSKKAHKERLEAAMKQLENDINLFERSKTIYTSKN